jgi:tetratricopeptide (TPR) repeat protein
MRRCLRSLSFMCLVSSCSLFAQDAPPTKRAQDRFQAGMQYIRDNKVRSGIKELKEAINADPKYEMAYLELASCFLKRGQNDRAKEVLRQCVEVNPAIAEAHYQLGTLLEQENDASGALRHYERCLDADHKHAEAYYRSARLYFKDKRYKESRNAFNEAYKSSARLDRQDRFDLCVILGANAARALNHIPIQGNPLDVKDLHYLLIADFVRPFCSEVYSFRTYGPNVLHPLFRKPGLSEHIDSERKKAVSFLREAIEIDPKSPKGYLEVGEMYLSSFVLEDNKEYIALARKELERAERNSVVEGLDERLARALFLLGVINMRDRKYESAIKQFQRANELKYPEIWVFPEVTWDQLIQLYAGYCFEQLGNLDKAIEFYRRASEEQLGYAAPYIRAGLVFLGRGDLNGALREFKLGEHASLGSRDFIEYGYLHNLIGRVYLKLGDRKKAIESAVESIRFLERDIPEFLSFLAELYAEDGQSDRALKALDKAIESAADPNAVRRLRNLRDELVRKKVPKN